MLYSMRKTACVNLRKWFYHRIKSLCSLFCALSSASVTLSSERTPWPHLMESTSEFYMLEVVYGFIEGCDCVETIIFCRSYPLASGHNFIESGVTYCSKKGRVLELGHSRLFGGFCGSILSF